MAMSEQALDDPDATNKKISIAMATYNGEKYLLDQLRSIAGQTTLPSELVVTDDASTDRTIAILKSFQEAAPFPVRIIENHTRLGVKENFLKAMALCSGDLIALCDQDDIWMPNKLAMISSIFLDSEVSLVIHSAQVIDIHGQKTGKRFPDYQRTRVIAPLKIGPYFSAWGFSMVFRRWVQDLISVVPEEIRLSQVASRILHDTWIQILAPVFGKIVLLKDDLASYRQHDANVVGVPKPAGPRSWRVDHSQMLADIEGKWRYHHFIYQCLNSIRSSDICVRHSLAEKGTKYYKNAARKYHLRSKLYNSGYGTPQKIFVFAELAFLGGYLPVSVGGFGVRTLPRDLSSFFQGQFSGKGHLLQ